MCKQFNPGTSEACVYATLKACDTLNKTLARYKASSDTWVQVVAKAAKAGAKLAATGRHIMGTGGAYPICSAACAVVEIDVLTGEHQILSTDILYDAGRSLNPYIDIGQVEGCFVQSAGFCLTEEQVRSPVDGRLISNGTWDYKPPCTCTIREREGKGERIEWKERLDWGFQKESLGLDSTLMSHSDES